MYMYIWFKLSEQFDAITYIYWRENEWTANSSRRDVEHTASSHLVWNSKSLENHDERVQAN